MTREEAKARIKNFKEQCPEDWETTIEAFNMAIEALEKKPKWIPVSERLPEEGARVFVTQIFGERTVVYCTIFPFEKTKEKYITAWMPLPEPYKTQDVIKRKAGTPRESYESPYNCENWIP